MAESFTQRLLEGLSQTHPAEWVAVFAGLVYIALIMRRHRLGWVAGGVSAAIMAVLAARAQLPMQALLQVFYVGAAVYGWWSWAPGAKPQRIGTWHWRGHAGALASCLLVAFLLSRLLEGEGYSAFPFTDSLVACAGLFATWLVARVCLENWAYWIVIDIVSMYLFFTQGLVVAALLFLLYLILATVGLVHWWRLWRKGQAVG